MTALPMGWRVQTVKDLLPIRYGKSLAANLRVDDGKYPVVGSAGEMARTNESLINGPTIIVGRKGNVGAVQLLTEGGWPIDTTYYSEVPVELDPRFVAHQLTALRLVRLDSSTATPSLRRQDFEVQELAVPPLDEQRRIVAILEDHLSHLDSAGSSLTGSRSRLKHFHQAALDACVQAAANNSSTSTTTIGSLAKVGTGATPLKSRADYYTGGDIPWITSGDLSQGLIQDAAHFVTPVALKETAITLWPVGTLLVAMYGEGKTRGTTAELGIEATTNQACAAIQMHDPDLVLKSWVRLILESNYWSMRRMASGGVQPNLNLGLVRGIQIPIPARDTQERLLRARDAQVEAEQVLALALVTSERRSQSLRRSLLEAAFSGRLTGRTSDMEIVEEMAGV